MVAVQVLFKDAVGGLTARLPRPIATDTNPHDYRAWYGIGQAYELLEQPIFALYYFRKASVLRYGASLSPRSCNP